MPEQKIRKALLLLISVSAVIRIFLAWSLELVNDEVYYWTYALYPDISHFDHPPMVGWIIQLFSLNLHLDSELFLRFGSVIFGSLNCFVIYQIGKQMKDPQTGLYAALLYSASTYGFFITGVLILPDTPQMLFWMLSLLFFIKACQAETVDKAAGAHILIAGLFTGLGLLSKYTTGFIWIGVLVYAIAFDRKWLKSTWFYIAIATSLLIFSPVIFWNAKNDFISFSYQGERINFFTSSLRWDYLLTEFTGEILYNNPVNFILLTLSLIALYRNEISINIRYSRLVLLISIPLISAFIAFSLFRRTLPHWNAPAYSTLLLFAAVYLRDRAGSNKLLPIPIRIAGILLLVMVILGWLQVTIGLVGFTNQQKTNPAELGKHDISLEITGWHQIGRKFPRIIEQEKEKRKFHDECALISYRWFPAANLDYYIGHPNHLKTLAIGSINEIHKYYWINRKRGGFYYGMDGYFITTSYDYADPFKILETFFERIEPLDTIKIERSGKHVMNAFVYRLENMKRLPVIK
jgi:4-amino-4-deoxy-L-arabinose transferase-like glycosyltransferase